MSKSTKPLNRIGRRFTERPLLHIRGAEPASEACWECHSDCGRNARIREAGHCRNSPGGESLAITGERAGSKAPRKICEATRGHRARAAQAVRRRVAALPACRCAAIPCRKLRSAFRRTCQIPLDLIVACTVEPRMPPRYGPGAADRNRSPCLDRPDMFRRHETGRAARSNHAFPEDVVRH